MKPRLSIARSMRWVGVMQAGRVVVQTIGVLTLARLLPAADFGVMALAMVAVTFANLFGDMGTGAAIVQQRSVSHAKINAVFWFNVGVGAILAALLCVFAPVLSRLLHVPTLGPVLISLSPAFVIGGAGIAHQALLERESKFRSLAWQSITAGGIGVAAGIASAYAGLGVYALVIQSLVGATVSCAILWKLSSWRPRGKPDFFELHAIRRFSGNVFLAAVMNYAHRNADTIIIGRVLGASQLGLYNMAYRLMMFPLQNLTFAFNRAAFPAYSHVDTPGEIVNHYLGALRKISLLTAPIMGITWLARDEIISLVLGVQWMGSAEVFAWLAPVGFLQSAVSTSGAVLQATNETRTLRNLTLVGTPLLVLSFACGVPWGIEGVAIAYCFANAIWLFPVMWAVMSKLGGTLSQALIAIFAPAMLMLVVFGVAYAYLNFGGVPPTRAQTSVATGVAAMAYMLLVMFLSPRRVAHA